MIARLLVLLFFAGVSAAGDLDPEKALAQVRALEADIEQLVGKVSPAVGAVMNYATVFEEATGKVGMRPRGQGSGIVVSRSGFFLTNVHVVDGSGYLTVTLPDGVAYRATRHADTGGEGRARGDIALLKLHGRKSYPYVDWRRGVINRLAPGNFAIAMGNPYGHAADGTPVVTLGVISGKGRAASDTGYIYVDAIQTDAEINPGNSGGPLFDIKGNLIGINGLGRRRSDGLGTGIGFAIPIDQVRLFMKDLIRSEGETVGYGFHGLQVGPSPDGKGVIIAGIARGSPADGSKLERGDTITKVNGKKIGDPGDFVNNVGKLPEDTDVRIQYKRSGKWRTTRFRLVSYGDYLASIGRSPNANQPLPLNERGYIAAEWAFVRDAITVKKVLPGSSAEKADLRVDDLIVGLNGAATPDTKALARVLSFLEAGTRVELEVRRGGKNRKLKLELSDAAEAAGMHQE